jgi:superfamily II DNA/RNA helicase
LTVALPAGTPGTDSLPLEGPSPSFQDLGLPPALVAALDRAGIERPFPIQTLTIPDALRGRDLLGRGQTGSGKTLAFGLPMLARLAARRSRSVPTRPRALVLVPTRELAAQVERALAPLARAVGLRVLSVYGGSSMNVQVRVLRRGVDVVVATPGRLTDLIERHACSLDRVEVTVLDEADHMADLGFLPAVTRLLDMVPAGGQRLLFSATLDNEVDVLVDRFLTDPVTHAVEPEVTAADRTDHYAYMVASSDKLQVATEIAGSRSRTLLFTRTKRGAERLAKQLGRAGVQAGALHGNLTQNARTRALAAFSEGRTPVLVATDVAARGIHVDDIDLVVHFDPPTEHKAYLHRSGRTARAGAAGAVLTLVMPDQLGEVARLLEAAGVQPTRTDVGPGAPENRQLPAPAPAPLAPPPRPSGARRGGRPARSSYRGARPSAGRAAASRPHAGRPEQRGGQRRRRRFD